MSTKSEARRSARVTERAAKAERKAVNRAAKTAKREEARALKAETKAARRAEREAEKERKKREGETGPKNPNGLLWRDVLVMNGCRIQKNVRTGNVQVLNARDRRVHKGPSLDLANAAFAAAVGSPCAGKHLVILLHGYGGRMSRMFSLRDAVRDAGFVAEVVQYPSLFREVDEIAPNIKDLILASAAFHGRIEEVSLVAFSMGGLVASSVVKALASHHGAPQFVRLITIGTPHRGSPLANLPIWLSTLGGPNLLQLRTNNERDLKGLLSRIGVVGGRGRRNFYTALGLLGDGDGVVELRSSIIEGAADSLVVNKVKHTALPSNPAVVAGVVRFLESGSFGEPSTK